MKFFSNSEAKNRLRENRLFLKVITPAHLRRMVGILGMALPFLLYVGNDFTIEITISSYYHTKMGPFFVAYFLFLGYMLIAYRGFPESNDDEASVIAGLASVGIALIRVTPTGTGSRDLLGWIHVILTIIFFMVLTYMSWSLFPVHSNHEWKKKFYKFSAIVMIVSMIGIMIFDVLDQSSFPNSTFWFEVVAFEFFGLSWFINSNQSR